jgi:hypothetical protein
MNEELIQNCQRKEAIVDDGFFKIQFVEFGQKIITAEELTLKSVEVLYYPGSHECLAMIDGKCRIAFSGDRCVQDGFEIVVDWFMKLLLMMQ